MSPWREWAEQHKEMGSVAADKASAVAVLHALHQHIPIESELVEIWDNKGEQCVVTTGAVRSEAILLPPCVPKRSDLVVIAFLKGGLHPYGVKVTVETRSNARSSTRRPMDAAAGANDTAEKKDTAEVMEVTDEGNEQKDQNTDDLKIQEEKDPEAAANQTQEQQAPAAVAGKKDEEKDPDAVRKTLEGIGAAAVADKSRQDNGPSTVVGPLSFAKKKMRINGLIFG